MVYHVRFGRMDSIRLGAMAGIAVTVLFSAMWTSAAIIDGEWVLGQETLSELGGDRPGAMLFNLGAIIAGLGTMVFWFGLCRTVERTVPSRTGTIALLAASIALVGVGAFPIDTGDPHTVASYSFFSLMLIALALLIVPIHRSPAFGRPFSISTMTALGIPLTSLALAPIELTEAVAVICMLAWLLLLSLKMLVYVQ